MGENVAVLGPEFGDHAGEWKAEEPPNSRHPDSCAGCEAKGKNAVCRSLPPCSPSERKDKRFIIWVHIKPE